jgi:hypothetical protein
MKVVTAVEAVSAKEVRFLRELEFVRALSGLTATGRLDVPTVDAPLVLSFTRGAVLLGAGHPKKSSLARSGVSGVSPATSLSSSTRPRNSWPSPTLLDGVATRFTAGYAPGASMLTLAL